MKRSKVIGIIPARYESSRFPGKPLATIHGKTLIRRTYENALRCKSLDAVVVATDDSRIFTHVQEFGGNVVMTSKSCLTGTDRIAEVVCLYPEYAQANIIVNIQGDEPTLDPGVIEAVVDTLKLDPTADVSTAIIRLKSEKDSLNPSVVKCVIDRKGFALYFSRGLIPAGKTLKFHSGNIYYKHLGIYGYKRQFLLHYAELPATPLQLAEDLEQLKVLENGFRIKTALVECECMDVNTPEDIIKVEKLLCKQNTSLSQEGFAPPLEKD